MSQIREMIAFVSRNLGVDADLNKNRRITIADIAARAGVSTGAVSYALNGRPGVSEATRTRILEISRAMGWAPHSAARSLSGAHTNTIGLVITRDPRSLGVEQFFMKFIAGIESALGQRDYSLLLHVVPSLPDEIRTLRQWHAAKKVDGVLLVDLRVDDPRLPVMSEMVDLPYVAVGHPVTPWPTTCIWTDDDAGMRECVRYLAQLGHRTIARVAGIPELAHTAVRDTAFVDEVAKLGISGRVVYTDYQPEQGAAATRSLLLDENRPTAIVYDNDVTALAGVGVAGELQLGVPDDVSIVAWDDSALCVASRPALSALTHDIVSFGEHAATRLLALIDGDAVASGPDATPVLLVRGSTGPAHGTDHIR